ncbi:MAG: signal recognition particle-docking protein FtsY [Candidatus Cloacimonadaceae bacterium]|nr:signal recognition particle-docking protein FtsY [Candidatus Cloacimonadaceae bacterium]MDP3113893.1 signal recognition particle-docking protein FtsY [Candidatus Cloacimonadaceae bacterium]
MLSVMRNLRNKLAKTKNGFLGKIAEAIRLRGKVDECLIEEIEDILLRSDTGVEMTQLVIDRLKEAVRFHHITDAAEVQKHLEEYMQAVLLQDYSEETSLWDQINAKPYVIVFVGVNGVGKTTSIGKVAYHLQNRGKKVLIVAGDTFRAAAIEQLAIWAERANAAIIRSQQDADPAAVIYDGINSALARGYDVVLIDTAGRQHTKDKLMSELSKIDRTIKKLLPDAPHQCLLVVDATTGQNAISQATHFDKAIKLTGLILTKYDGTSKGGIIFNLKHKLHLPVKLIGVGETVEDLEVFRIEDFIRAFFSETPGSNQEENQ